MDEDNPILPLQTIQGEKKVQDTVISGNPQRNVSAGKQMQLEADQATIQLARGDDIDLHKVMIRHQGEFGLRNNHGNSQQTSRCLPRDHAHASLGNDELDGEASMGGLSRLQERHELCRALPKQNSLLFQPQ